MNVYQMYVANGNRAGFLVHRNSWAPGRTARILSIARKSEGPLPGSPPYHGSALVLAELPWGEVGELRCPGTAGYELVRTCAECGWTATYGVAAPRVPQWGEALLSGDVVQSPSGSLLCSMCARSR